MQEKDPYLPPRFVIRNAWRIHRALFRWSGGRLGLQAPKVTDDGTEKEGLAALTTLGRKSRQERLVMIAYFEDGDDFVTMAMNGWGEGQPAWWLNLLANPKATLRVPGRTMPVEARKAAPGEEHDRLWARWCEVDTRTERYSARRSEGTDVVILSPVS